MRKFFYSISVFVFLCALSAGYYGSYRLAEQRSEGAREISREARQEARADTETDAGRPEETETDAGAGNPEKTKTGSDVGRPEEINTGISEAGQPIEEAQAVSSVEEKEIYCLKETDGYVMVYERDGITLYEATAIVASLLPESLREELRNGKYITSQEELYRFLENYSS
ncbi:MAG: hypothetical protein Q4C91_05900 [Eubacteriales bacterium]|nr:hypothetical protein [Eubacteriales bacterium]